MNRKKMYIKLNILGPNAMKKKKCSLKIKRNEMNRINGRWSEMVSIYIHEY